MARSNPAPVTAPGTSEEKWKQQVRLACIQAVCTRAVAAQAVWDDFSVIRMANALAEFVLTGAKGD